MGFVGTWDAGIAKPLRVECEAAWRHVMSRDNERRRIVRDDADPTLSDKVDAAPSADSPAQS